MYAENVGDTVLSLKNAFVIKNVPLFCIQFTTHIINSRKSAENDDYNQNTLTFRTLRLII